MIKVLPKLREMIWGSYELGKLFGTDKKIGEVWLLSGHPMFVTELEDGRDVNSVMEEIIGRGYPRFPLLVKIISSSQWLSVQVHPNDEEALALETNEPWGKTEGWFFLKESEVAIGENDEKVKEAIETNNWNDALTFFRPSPKSFLFLPAGTVHALGPDSFLIEVQESSDLTYRIHDWGRGRELHLDKALKVIKKVNIKDIYHENVKRFDCEHFRIRLMKNGTSEGFSVLITLEGGRINGKSVGKYETFIVPIGEKVEIECNVLEVKLGEFFLKYQSGDRS